MADSPACPNGGQWCTFVEDLTHNQQLARAADWLIAKPLSILLLIVMGIVVRLLAHRLIDRLGRRAAAGPIPSVLADSKVQTILRDVSPDAVERRRQRAETMASLLKSITTAIIVTIVAFMTIAELGYDIAPLIASAGIIGIAVAFGAQSLVKDFLGGIFLILEDQYGVGDTVQLAAATGIVEAVGLRVTRLRDADGVVWYVRNGEILAVGNRTQGAATPGS